MVCPPNGEAEGDSTLKVAQIGKAEFPNFPPVSGFVWSSLSRGNWKGERGRAQIGKVKFPKLSPISGRGGFVWLTFPVGNEKLH